MIDEAKLRHDAKRTSREAALLMEPKLGTLRSKVLNAIRVAGKDGMTDDELVAKLGLSPNSVRPRRVELVEGGWVVDSGRCRWSFYGNDAIVWTATDKVCCGSRVLRHA